jgi:hypothetical protein
MPRSPLLPAPPPVAIPGCPSRAPPTPPGRATGGLRLEVGVAQHARQAGGQEPPPGPHGRVHEVREPGRSGPGCRGRRSPATLRNRRGPSAPGGFGSGGAAVRVTDPLIFGSRRLVVLGVVGDPSVLALAERKCVLAAQSPGRIAAPRQRVSRFATPPTVSQTAPEHIMTCEPMRVLGRISVYSPASHHSRTGSATGAATRWPMAPAGHLPRHPALAAQRARAHRAWRVGRRRARQRAVSASGGPRLPVGAPICSTRTADTPVGMSVSSDPGRSSPASAARSCCRHAALKIKKA